MIKKINMIFYAIILSLGMVSCDDKVDSANSFSVSTEKPVYKVGETVVFSFTGNPDYITFYSGEPSHEYKHKNRTEIDINDISSLELSFDVFAQYGKAEPNQPQFPLKVLLTDEFEGVKKDSEEKDKVRILALEQSADDLTELAEMPAKANDKKSISLDITKYARNFTMAFKYEGYFDETSAQRTFTVSNIEIKSTLKNGQEVILGQAMDLGFIAYDMLELPKEADGNRYYVGATNGSWNLNNIGKNEFKIAGGPKSVPANIDWLISSPMKLNKAIPDKGDAIKDITVNLDKYAFTYKNPGKYEVSFVGGNANYKGQKEVVRTVIIEVTE